MYIGELVESLGKLTPVDRRKLQQDLIVLAHKHTGDSDEEVAAMLQATKKVTARDDETAGKKAKGTKRGKRRAAGPQLELLEDEEEAS
jgi:hypothetical protein